MRTRPFLFPAIAGATLVAIAASAQVPAGTGQLSGSQSLKIKHCDKVSDSVNAAVVLGANGNFSITNAGDVLTGTSTGAGNVNTLMLDAGSQALVTDLLEDAATQACGTEVDITSVSFSQGQLKVNKRATSAKLQVKATATGTSSEGSGTGKYKLKAKGPWNTAT
jgi:hypothetical protein